ncbi:hypothetical protein BKA56DRAFT_345234 [Ilyonectria sp. MPI-CAGE-AT-0026]|nr:hypothetical protein BKA56DRAFT_345234 [Ilyonectria sp. MPI-CAGE-AT-0026]
MSSSTLISGVFLAVFGFLRVPTKAESQTPVVTSKGWKRRSELQGQPGSPSPDGARCSKHTNRRPILEALTLHYIRTMCQGSAFEAISDLQHGPGHSGTVKSTWNYHSTSISKACVVST